MNRSKLYWVLLATGLVVLLVARPMFGVQPVKGEPKEMAKLMVEAKLTLSKAIEVAEKETKGTAVKAFAEKYPDGVRVDVYCVAGEAVKWVEVDHAGKVLSVKDATEKEPGWGKEEPKKKPAEEPAKKP